MKVCLVNSVASIYRAGIYQQIADQYDCDFYFNRGDNHLQLMDYKILKNKVTEVPYWEKKNFVYQKGIPFLAFKNYEKYIVMGAPYYISTWILLLLLKFTPRKKIYLWTHGCYGKENRGKQVLERIFYGMSDGLLLYGDYAKSIMEKRGYRKEKLHVVHNSLAYSEQLMLRNSDLTSDIYRDHFGNGNPVIIMIGRLNKRKKLSQLVMAIKKLKDKGLLYNVTLIGNGEDRDNLERLVVESGLNDQFWFYGACYNEKENAELVYNSNLCVMPGDIGLTAIHSMMFGVPVITHNHFPFHGPEFEAIHEGLTGSFFEYDSIDSLSETIRKWFAEHKDVKIVRQNCYTEIDNYWTPEFQMRVIDNVIQ